MFSPLALADAQNAGIAIGREKALHEAADAVACWRVSQRDRLHINAHDSLRDLEDSIRKLAGVQGGQGMWGITKRDLRREKGSRIPLPSTRIPFLCFFFSFWWGSSQRSFLHGW